MKATHRFRFLALVLAAALCATLLAGCGKGEEVDLDFNNFVRVHSVEELLKAIKPNTQIMVEAGKYDLSEYVEEMFARNYEFRVDGKEYVELRECYDGTEIVIRGVEGLSIFGGGEDASGVEFTVDPRYATVLNFEDCRDLILEGMTLGHTETGECSGSVLGFTSCRGVTLYDLDLYGCGTYGISAYAYSGDITVSSCTIRDCEYGPFDLNDVYGKIEFFDCDLTGSRGGGYYYAEDASLLSFYRCTFGDEESSLWLFRDDAYFEDCEWSENAEYPDYPYYEDGIAFDADLMDPFTEFDDDFFSGTEWVGYRAIDRDALDEFDLPVENDYGEMQNIYLHFGEKFGGTLSGFDGEHDFSWTKNDDGTLTLKTDDGSTYSVSAFVSYADNAGRVWLRLDADDAAIWMY